MSTDALALQREATHFDLVSVELQDRIFHVESIAFDLESHWKGATGAAAQVAFSRFNEAGQRQVQELNDISQHVHQAASQYSEADEQQRADLEKEMGFNLQAGQQQSNSAGFGSEQPWDFAYIDAARGSVQHDASTIRSLLDEGKSSLARLSAVWGGSGSDAYQAVQQRWDATAYELSTSLQNLSRAIGEAAAAVADTEQGIGRMFD